MDLQLKLGSGLKLTKIGGKSTALDGAAVSTNEDDCRANFTSVDDQGDPIVPKDGKAALTFVVKVADNASGDYTIDFSECKVFQDSTNFNYKTSSTPLTIKVSGNGNTQQPVGNADINFSFADKDGKTEISAKPGDELTIYANISTDNKPVSAMDVQFKLDSSLKLTQIGGKSVALDNAAVSTNETERRANFTSVDEDGEPIVPANSKAAFIIKVKVADDASNGKHTIGFSECKVFKDSTNFNYTTSTAPITVTVTGGKDITYKLGDVNNDGNVNAVDASQVLKYYAKLSTGGEGGFTEAQKLAANVNGDSIIDAVDAAKILSYYAYVSTVKEGTPKTMEEFMGK
ncbi:MAG: hypothetical protein IKW96_07435 [Ruminococcus sp.]|nr:hypothetical protein [Ruminococcus sp.]